MYNRPQSRSNSDTAVEDSQRSVDSECCGDGTDRRLEKFAEAFWVDPMLPVQVLGLLKMLTWCSLRDESQTRSQFARPSFGGQSFAKRLQDG